MYLNTQERPAAASTQPQQAEFPPVPGSPGNCFWKQLADNESVDGRDSIRETGADLDRETVVSFLFGSESKGKRDRDQNVVQRQRKSSQNP